MTSAKLHRKLQRLLGQQFDYLGETWILIEILADIDSVVLRRCRDCGRGGVQQNLYGMPNRRAGDTLTLAISDPDDEGYSQDLLLLLEGRRAD
jgi:hypothetical protein